MHLPTSLLGPLFEFVKPCLSVCISDKHKLARAGDIPESEDDESISSTSSTALSGRSWDDGDETAADKSLKRPFLDIPRPLPLPRLWEDPPWPTECFLPMDDWRSYRGNPWTCLEVADSIVQVAAMFATLVRCSKASRKPLTPKRGNKDYYKGMIGSGLLRSWN